MLSPRLRQQLAALIQAYDQGCGPVEHQALQRLTANLPMTPLQIRSYAEACYPAEIRSFLDALGYQILYRGDLERALARGATAAPLPSNPGVVATAGPGRADKRKARSKAGPRVVVLAMAVLVIGFILDAVLPRIERGHDLQDGRTTQMVPPPARPAKESLCLQSLRAGAASWCESALTGAPARDRISQADMETCGDRLRANSDTVRIALNRVLDDEATYTFTPSEARERCEAAATLAVPREKPSGSTTGRGFR